METAEAEEVSTLDNQPCSVKSTFTGIASLANCWKYIGCAYQILLQQRCQRCCHDPRCTEGKKAGHLRR